MAIQGPLLHPGKVLNDFDHISIRSTAKVISPCIEVYVGNSIQNDVPKSLLLAPHIMNQPLMQNTVTSYSKLT